MFTDNKTDYATPNDALEKVQEDDQQELTYVDSWQIMTSNLNPISNKF